MPVVAENSERRRKVSRAALVAAGAFSILAVCLIIAPAIRPVALHFGDRWLLVELDRQPFAAKLPPVGSRRLPPGAQPVWFLRDDGSPLFTAEAKYTIAWVSLGHYSYVIQCFRGQRGWRDTFASR